MRRTSAKLSLVLEGLDSGVVSNSEGLVASVVGSFEEQLKKSPITFKVGDYEVVVEAFDGEGRELDIHLRCSCNYWQYQGPEYHAQKNGYLFGKPRGTASKPDSKDPKGSHKVCKHAYAVLSTYFGV